MLNLLDIIKTSEGKGENGAPKSGFSVAEQIIDESNDVKILKEQVFTEPEIKFILNGDYIIFDLIFPSTASGELRILWNRLEKFGDKQKEYLDKNEDLILEFTVLPLELLGKYFYTLINPIMWTLQSPAPGSYANSIRLLFETKAMNIFGSDGINEREIDAEIEKEEFEEQRMAEVEAIKQAEHEEYLERLNQRFNNR